MAADSWNKGLAALAGGPPIEALQQALDRRDSVGVFDWLAQDLKAGVSAGVGQERRRAPARARLVVEALELLESDAPDVSERRRERFFDFADRAVGRTALMLSGSGTLAPFHLGVVRELWSRGLLPGIVSGASGGAHVAATLGTRRPEELAAFLRDARLGEEVSKAAGVLAGNGAGRWRRLSPEELEARIVSRIPDLTFAEAFARSGMAVNITVTPAMVDAPALMLGPETTPDVLVRDAVRASCAVPGAFAPWPLREKRPGGRRAAFAGGQLWVDGALGCDLPTEALAERFGARHFIASVVNPMVAWALDDRADQTPLTAAARYWNGVLFRAHVSLTEPFARALTSCDPRAAWLVRTAYAIASQRYAADVLIVPTERIVGATRTLSPITPGEARALVAHGVQRAAEKVSLVDSHARVRGALDDILGRRAA